MMRVMLVLAVIIQIVVAIQSDGLTRSMAELTAFLLVAALVLDHRKASKPTTATSVES
ncbi:hypothetical protein [Vibrio profundi]|uniref:hypothetical protein n=1 Tax=Vibrio profundi TaxID=1774960 RepID=UPI0037368962